MQLELHQQKVLRYLLFDKYLRMTKYSKKKSSTEDFYSWLFAMDFISKEHLEILLTKHKEEGQS